MWNQVESPMRGRTSQVISLPTMEVGGMGSPEPVVEVMNSVPAGMMAVTGLSGAEVLP